MSGRKSCEVAAVLKQGESIRKLTDDIYSKEIEACYKKYLACLDTENEIKDAAASTSAELEEAAQEMFGDNGRSLLTEFKSCKKSLSEQKVSDKGKAIVNALDNLNRELSQADAQAESIRNSIRNKNWYCDKEYAQAQELVRTYENLRSDRVNLERQMKGLLTAENQKLSSMNASAAQLKNLAEQIKNMNVTAKKRKEANSFRNELREALNSLDAPNAEKFFASEFAAIKKNISVVVGSSDDEVLSAFKKNYTAVADFKKKLAERVALWHKQKNDAEKLFAQMETAASESFVDPIDHYNGEENPNRINLFDYLKTYGGKNLAGDYSRRRDEAAELIRQEKFLESMTVINSTLDFAENARQEGLNLQESMLKKIELAGAIQDVMQDLRYDTDLQIINENPNDGFKITCTVGDETIDFQKVSIDDSGKIVVDIDHHEGKGANCGGSWKDISNRLNEIGIPVTEVRMSNGASVLHHAQRVGTSTGQLSVQH